MNEEQQKYLDLIMSMSLDCKMNIITWEHYINTLKMIIETLTNENI